MQQSLGVTLLVFASQKVVHNVPRDNVRDKLAEFVVPLRKKC